MKKWWWLLRGSNVRDRNLGDVLIAIEEFRLT